MTIQLHTVRHGKSKAALQAALEAMPDRVEFYNPSIMVLPPENHFTGADIKVGERFPCVLDPETRRRFATIERTPQGYRVR